MSKSGVEDQALKRNGVNAKQADDSFATIAPAYTRLSTGTVGYSPTQVADMRTAALQSTGGSLASAAGKANIAAARTGNAGASTAALDDIARTGTDTLADADLGISQKNADLEQRNMDLGLAGLSGIYDEGLTSANQNLSTAQQANASRKSFINSLVSSGLGALGTGYAYR